MAATPFDYSGLFAKNAPVNTRGVNRHARYDFAVAYPDPDVLPLDALVESLKIGLEREGRDLAYYPTPMGYLPLRQTLAEKIGKERNVKVTAEDIVLVAGSGEGIAMFIQAFTDPGDVVLAEEYVYLGTLRQLRRYWADVRGVKCDAAGLLPDDLRAVIRKAKGEGKKVKYLYTIPTFQNPLGWTMQKERREQVLQICLSEGVPIFEDDCYYDLSFGEPLPPSFYEMDDSGAVVYSGSFSKIIAPGMRMGFLAAPPRVMERVTSFKIGGGVNQFAALAINEFMKSGIAEHIDEQNETLVVKRDAMIRALGENFGGFAKWTVPNGGLYIWVEMPENVDMAALQETAYNEGVGYYSGNLFSPEGKGKNCLRLCFGHPSPQTNYEGVTELARIMERHGLLKG